VNLFHPGLVVKVMSTKLDKPIRREIDIDGELFTLIVGPDGLRLTRKRFRSGLAVSWKALLRQLDRSEQSHADLTPDGMRPAAG
jgi:hypothetical protein